jgi:hypothetical protein
MVTRLLQAAARVHLGRNREITFAAQAGDLYFLKEQLIAAEAPDLGQLLNHAACGEGKDRLETCKLLIALKANVNTVGAKRCTPLISCAANRKQTERVEIFKLLIASKADVNVWYDGG